jgi:hypothetical protein
VIYMITYKRHLAHAAANSVTQMSHDMIK